MLFFGESFSVPKHLKVYLTNVLIRGIANCLPDDFQAIGRGFLNGLYEQYGEAY